MILHLLEDNIHVDYTIVQFETVAHNQNKLVVLVPSDDYVCNHIKYGQDVDFIVKNSFEYSDLCNNLSNYKAVISHNLFDIEKERVLLKAPNNVKLAWVLWGGDFYNRRENILKYIGKRTKKRFFNNISISHRLKSNIMKYVNGEKYFDKYQIAFNTFRKLDFCLTDLYEDYEVVKKSLKCDFQWAWYTYYNIDETIGSLKDKIISGNNILLGNSASTTNNHLEAFELIKEFDLGKRKIVTPLSYGDDNYKNAIIKEGIDCFGENFFPLTVFLERDKYNSYILSCSIAIMNHYRHQAMGNIITALWLGSKVYLSKRSTTYSYFKRLGVHIYSIEDDFNLNNKKALENLSQDKFLVNRKILSSEYSKENVLKKVNHLVEILYT